MAHKVFICHSSNDKLVADAACAALEAQRIPCWIAPRDILAGEEYGESIVDALSGCQIVLLIFSRDANNSPQVRREIERAVSKGKIIVPFRIEDVMPSRAMEFALSNTHWLDALTPPMERYLLQLCDTIARLIQKHTVAEAPLWKPPEPVVVETIVKPEPIPVQAKASQEPVAAELGKKPEPLWEQTKPSPEIPSEETGKKAEPFTQEAKATAKPTVEPTPEAADSRSAKEEIGESKSGWRRVPGWAWGVLAVVVLAGVFAAVQLFGPAFFAAKAHQADALNRQEHYEEAASLYHLACVGGNAYACFRLGYKYQHGEGVSDDYSRAFKLYSKACDGGNVDGCIYVDFSYEGGIGVAQSYPQAFMLYSKTCDSGSAEGCMRVGNLYESGSGVAQSYSQAAALYSKACHGGYADGCIDLGIFYERGLGVAKDPDKARQLFTKACNMGSEFGCDRLKDMR